MVGTELLIHSIGLVLIRAFNRSGIINLQLSVRVFLPTCFPLFVQWCSLTRMHNQFQITCVINPRTQLNLKVTKVFIIVTSISALCVSGKHA